MSKYERQEKSQRKHTITSSSTPRNGSTPVIPSTPRQRPEWRGPGYKPKKNSNAGTSAVSSSKRTPTIPPTSTTPLRAHQDKEDESSSLHAVPLALQQALLNVFARAYPISGSGNAGANVVNEHGHGYGQHEDDGNGSLLLTKTMQEVKGALYERDFARAFGSEPYLEAYAVRWSPGRALAYAGIWSEVVREFSAWDWDVNGIGSQGAEQGVLRTSGRSWQNDAKEDEEAKEIGSTQRTLRLVAFGGGVAEVGAAALLLRSLTSSCGGRPVVESISPAPMEMDELGNADTISDSPESTSTFQPTLNCGPSISISLQLIDVASWSPTITALISSLTSPPPLSKYASASARASNAAFLSRTALNVSFQQKDILNLSQAELRALITGCGEGEEVAKRCGPSLVMLGFTLNELFGSSIAKTTRLLLELGEVMVEESLLLVIDSPGSYSETTLGGNGAGKAEGDGTDGDGGGGDDGGSASGRQAEDGTKMAAGKKKWPMQWLLDHVLLGERYVEKKIIKGGGTRGRKTEGSGRELNKEQEAKEKRQWAKVLVDESRWSRIEEQLRYPVPLENMRMQVHLFRRL